MRFSFFLVLLFFMIASCNKDSSDVISNSSPHALVSVYAVVPSAPELNVFFNGSTVAINVPFGSYTLYNNVVPGMVDMLAQSSSRAVRTDASFSVAANEYYSLFLTGTTENIKPVLLQDSFPAADTGYSGLRFLVLSPGVLGINLYFAKDSTIKKDTTSRDSIISRIAWVNRNYTDSLTSDTINTFRKFASGTYSLYAINKLNIKDTLARTTGKTFSDRTNYTIMLEGLYNKSATDTTSTLVIGTRMH